MRQYQKYLRYIKDRGVTKSDRTGTGTKSVFGYQMRFNLRRGFPLLTTKKMFLRGIIHELIWMLRGESNIKSLVDNDVHIWDEWPYRAYLMKNGLPVPDSNSPEWKTGIAAFAAKIKTDATFAATYGELGPVYGVQWRKWKTPDGRVIDQITDAINMIKKNPDSRRIIVSAWNVADIEAMSKSGLPPCHAFFQFYVAEGRLSCQLYQRSVDSFLGLPFNIASYSILTHMVAHVTGLKVGDFVWTGGDCHIYQNHMAQVEEQLSRKPRKLPKLKIKRKVDSIFDFTYDDFELIGYDPHPKIAAPIAV